MPWADWDRIRRAGRQAEYDDAREQWVRSAFIAFEMGAGGEGKKFGDYLATLGLQEPGQQRKKAPKVDKERAFEDARRIMAKDPKRRDGG